MQGKHLISIIVPVYNVEQYVDDCIKSIIDQTYTNLEILLINDGSNDCSEEICLNWAKKDERILYVRKKNETLGPTRNLGIQMARGEYIAFVDSDDWIDSMFIEKLYRCARDGDQDFVRCDYYRAGKNGKTAVNNNEYYSSQRFDVHKMIGSVQAITIWTGLYKKRLWTEHAIRMPAGPHQDLAVLGLIFIYAQRAGVCHECLYYYREDRADNTTQKVMGEGSILAPLKHLMEEYKRRNLFDEYRDDLLQVCIGQLNTSMDRFMQSKNTISRKEYNAAIKTFFKEEFQVQDTFFNNKIAALGGYDLQRVLSKVHYNDRIQDYKYQHSSIISVMSNCVDFSIENAETYREKMIEAECSKKLKEALINRDIDYILIDFMEERYDILDFGDQRYLTYSDALKEKGISMDNVKILKRNSEECMQKWKDSCDWFIKLLRETVYPQHIFLVKFFLTEEYGEYGREHEYENLAEIKKVNVILNSYYDYFESNLKGINIIELDTKYYFTDQGMRYGCYPWHLNANAQYDVQNKVAAILKV
ncbi:MAG: glycosyltransferase [Ruminococcus sp.]|nr:glycosyltransferase [Ruminococcus sp.]